MLLDSHALCSYMNISPLLNMSSVGALVARTASDFNVTLCSLDIATDFTHSTWSHIQTVNSK